MFTRKRRIDSTFRAFLGALHRNPTLENKQLKVFLRAAFYVAIFPARYFRLVTSTDIGLVVP